MKDKKNWKIVYKIIQDYLEEEHGTPMMKKPYKDDGNIVFTDCDGNKFGVDELIDWYKILVDDGNIDDDLGLLTTLDLIPSHSDSTDGLPQIKIIGEPVRIGKLEVAQNDFPNRMSWSDATAACEDLGEGWRLPTKDELNLMYINRVVIGGFANKYYWSSTELDFNYAWYFIFYSGFAYDYTNKVSTFYVRAVRDATPFKIIGEPVRIGKLEVAQNDFTNQCNWREAVKTCASLGEGWRLPTKDELNLMYINRVAIGGFANNIYWSSTEIYPNYACYFNFTNGLANKFLPYKTNTYYVRAVRDATSSR